MVVVRKIVLCGMVLFGVWSGVTDISEDLLLSYLGSK